MRAKQLLVSLFLPINIILITTPIVTSCNNNKCPLIEPTAEETTKTIAPGEKYADFVFKFSRKLVFDDFDFHIDEKSRDFITISNKKLESSGKEVTLRISYFDAKLPTEKTTLNFKLTFNYFVGATLQSKDIDCTLIYNPVPTYGTVLFMIENQVYKTTEVLLNNLVEKPTDPTITGGTFRGWYKDSAFKTPWDFQKDKITNTTTEIFGAVDWDVLTVTYDVNGGKWASGVTPPVQQVYYGTSTQDPCVQETPGSVPAPTKEHYRYRGWYKDTQCQDKWDFINDKVIKNITLYVGWEPVTYTVHFKDVSSQQPAADSQAVKYGNLLVEPEHEERPGFVFDGWYTDSSCSTKWNFDSDLVDKDMTLWCRYNESPGI